MKIAVLVSRFMFRLFGLGAMLILDPGDSWKTNTFA